MMTTTTLLAAGALMPGTARGALTATFTSAASVPVTAGSYTASGTVTLALNFTPVPGTILTVVNNTGPGFINGAFSNLAQGQVVRLAHAGVTYNLVANYYGGTGNDLVLQWADTVPVAWGSNASGQLGDGTTTQAAVPVSVVTSGVLEGRTVLAVAAGEDHSLALCADGALVTWGFNLQGELGSATYVQTIAKEPVLVDASGVLAGRKVIAIAAGEGFSLALCSDGTLASWGYNAYGQLGNGTTVNSSTPVNVDRSGVLAGKTITAIAAGHGQGLALCSDGTQASWGENNHGQLGDGTTFTRKVPVQVLADGLLTGTLFAAIAAGQYHCLALSTDGTLLSWGSNSALQLGTGSGTPTQALRPVMVQAGGVLAGRKVAGLAAGGYHSLVRCADGFLAAWGSGLNGQLGNGGTADSAVPVAVDATGVLAGRKAARLVSGGYHGLIQCADGALASWGWNVDGQIGDGTTVQRPAPVLVDASGLPAGSRLMLPQSGMLSMHNLALNALAPRPQQVTLRQPSGPALTTGGSVDLGSLLAGAHLPAAFTLGNAGSEPLGVTGVTIDGPDAADFAVTSLPAATVPCRAVTRIVVTFSPGSAGSKSAVLHVASNDPATGVFHLNLTGTGVGPGGATFTASYTTGQEVPLTAGSFTAGSFTATGGTVSLGLNYAPVTGSSLTVVNNPGTTFINGTFDNLAQGQLVTLRFGGTSYPFVANYYGGDGNDLVLQWAGILPLRWGYTGNGYGNQTPPVAMTTNGALTGRTILSLAGGYKYAVALCADGTVVGWDDGTGPAGNQTPPVALNMGGPLAGRRVITLSGGYNYCLALCTDGTLAQWNLSGSAADFAKPATVIDATGVLAGKTIVRIAAGTSHSLVLCSDGCLAAWGYNYFGQLGNDTYDNVLPSPVAVVQNGVLANKTVIAIAAGGGHSLAL